MYVFVTLSILQSQFIEKGFKKTENSEQNVVLLLFLLTLENTSMCLTCVRAHSHVCVHTDMHACVNANVHVYMHIDLCVCVCIWTCMHV